MRHLRTRSTYVSGVRSQWHPWRLSYLARRSSGTSIRVRKDQEKKKERSPAAFQPHTSTLKPSFYSSTATARQKSRQLATARDEASLTGWVQLCLVLAGGTVVRSYAVRYRAWCLYAAGIRSSSTRQKKNRTYLVRKTKSRRALIQKKKTIIPWYLVIL